MVSPLEKDLIGPGDTGRIIGKSYRRGDRSATTTTTTTTTTNSRKILVTIMSYTTTKTNISGCNRSTKGSFIGINSNCSLIWGVHNTTKSLTVKIDVSKMQIFYFGLRLVAGQTFVIIG